MTNVPIYTNSSGEILDAQGVSLLNPDGTLYTPGTVPGSATSALQSAGNTLIGALVSVPYTDASISSATGASQPVAAAASGRKALIIANPAATTWWINPSGGTAAANGAGCFELPPGGYWSPKPAPTNAVTGIGTTASVLTVATA